MAKYIIDTPEKEMVYLNVWKCEDGKCVWTETYNTSDLRPYTASESYIDGLKKGQNDAWNLARKIICPSDCCEDSISAHTKEIFNKDGWKIRDIFTDLSYQEAKSKYNEWQKQKDEIHVGDEVILYDNVKMIVTQVDRGTSIQGVDKNGECYECMDYNAVKKTGRHFDGIKDLLKVLKS